MIVKNKSPKYGSMLILKVLVGLGYLVGKD
jgi:hypothetical protein